jgi:predicted PurR-regulated permease PerM
MRPAPSVPPLDPAAAFPPPDRTVALNLGAAALFLALVTVAIAFDWVALKGVFVVAFLSVGFAYLLLPVVSAIRREVPARTGGWRPSLTLTVLIIYLGVALIVAPIWAIWGGKIVSQVPDVAREVPRHVARFVAQVRASEQWHEQFAFERETRALLRATTHTLSERIQLEVSDVGAEIVRARLVVPWLAGVPLIAWLLVARWPAFHRSAARAVPTPHLKWRTDQFLRHVNMLLAAYTRAQALSALVVGLICGFGFVLMKLPNAAMLGIVAGLLEAIPIAGPLAVAISATSVASSSQVLLVLAFLGGVRGLQDYVIYPRLIRRTMHLHPVAVVTAIWVGAMVGGVIGVCLAVPTVGVLQVLRRHYREYREIERLVREHAVARPDTQRQI